MSLPSVLQPAWPILKRGHRFLSLCMGFVTRAVAPFLANRGGPRGASLSSAETTVRSAGAQVHPVGHAERRQVPPAIGVPEGHWRFAAADISLPAQSVLEVRNARLVGDYAAVITAEGDLEVETSNYFGIAGWREHPIFLRPLLPEPERLSGTVLSLATRGTSENYYHFVFDALTRYATFQEAMPDVVPDAVVVPHAARYQRQFLELLGIDRPLLQPHRDKVWLAERLLIPSTPNHELDAPAWAVSWLRETFRPSTSSSARRLYITRGDKPNTRRFVREAELWPDLERRGFVRIDPGAHSVQEQIDLFHGAEVVLAPHGAGLTNIVFAAPGLRVLEMFAGDYVHLGLWNISHSLPGCQYRYLVADPVAGPGSRMGGVLTDIDIPVERVLAQLDELMA